MKQIIIILVYQIYSILLAHLKLIYAFIKSVIIVLTVS
jgi:hypothetical protein